MVRIVETCHTLLRPVGVGTLSRVKASATCRAEPPAATVVAVSDWRVSVEGAADRRRLFLAGKHALLLAMSLLMLFPVLLTVSTAFKERVDVRTNPFGLFTSFSTDNMARAWTVGNFGEYMWNTLVLSVPSTIIVVALSTMAGYAFARLAFRGRTLVYYLLVLGLLVPFFTYMIPLYFQLQGLGLLDTLPGAILVMSSTGLAFGTVFMRAFFSDLPPELEQAARIDGAFRAAIRPAPRL